MILAHKKKGLGAHLVTPISKLHCHLAGGLFVDDMDLFHLDMQRVETSIEVHERLQDAGINWGKLLIVTGGALKPEKCSFYLTSFKWKADGTWIHDQNETNPNFALGVPMADSVGYCSGYYEARRASGRASGKKYEAQIVIFCILLAVNRFSRISRKVESR